MGGKKKKKEKRKGTSKEEEMIRRRALDRAHYSVVDYKKEDRVKEAGKDSHGYFSSEF